MVNNILSETNNEVMVNVLVSILVPQYCVPTTVDYEGRSHDRMEAMITNKLLCTRSILEGSA